MTWEEKFRIVNEMIKLHIHMERGMWYVGCMVPFSEMRTGGDCVSRHWVNGVGNSDVAAMDDLWQKITSLPEGSFFWIKHHASKTYFAHRWDGTNFVFVKKEVDPNAEVTRSF